MKKKMGLLLAAASLAVVGVPAGQVQAEGVGQDADSAVSVSAVKRPVVLVPGTGGTRLYGNANDYNTDSAGVVWLEDTTIYGIDDADLEHTLSLKQNPASTSPVDVIPKYADVTNIYFKSGNYGLDAISGVDTLGVESYFRDMIDAFKAQGYVPGQQLFGFPYDWRQDFSKHYARMTQTINQALAASGSDQVYLLGHSQGGLLIKAYLLDNPSMQAKVAGFIPMGAPFYGAAKSARAGSQKLGGYDFDIDLLGFGIAKETGYKIGQFSPAVFQMMPTKLYQQRVKQYTGWWTVMHTKYDYGWGTTTNLAPKTTDAATAHTYMKTYMDNDRLEAYADGTHARWDTANHGVPTHMIYGNSVNTEVAYEYEDEYMFGLYTDTDVNYRYWKGDGTVPIFSATGNDGTVSSANGYLTNNPTGGSVQSWYNTGADHVGMVKDASVLNYILGVVNGGSAAASVQAAPQELTALDFVEYSTKDKNARLTATITDRHSGAIETVEIADAKVTRQGVRSDVIVKATVLTNKNGEEKLDVQFGMEDGRSYDIRIHAADDTELKVRTYRSEQAQIKNRTLYEPVKMKKNGSVKMTYEKGKKEFQHEGKALKHRQ